MDVMDALGGSSSFSHASDKRVKATGEGIRDERGDITVCLPEKRVPARGRKNKRPPVFVVRGGILSTFDAPLVVHSTPCRTGCIKENAAVKVNRILQEAHHTSNLVYN